MQRIRSWCVASANYQHYQTAGESTFVSAFGIRTIDNSVTLNASHPWIVSILRTVAGFQKGTEMGSDCGQPMHSRRVSVLEMPDKTSRSLDHVLSRAAGRACFGSLRSCHCASRYPDNSGFFYLALLKFVPSVC